METREYSELKDSIKITYLIVTVFSGMLFIFVFFMLAGKMNGTDATIATAVVATFVIAVLWLKNMFAKVIVISICLTLLKYFFGTLTAIFSTISSTSYDLASGRTSFADVRDTVQTSFQKIGEVASKEARAFMPK